MAESLQPLRIFLDSNVLFSASYSERSRFLRLWRLVEVTTLISPYVIGEVRRNARNINQALRLNAILTRTTIVKDGDAAVIPPGTVLVEKDRPILASAIAAGADYLLTGDIGDFSHLYGSRIRGVIIIQPGEFLDANDYRLIP